MPLFLSNTFIDIFYSLNMYTTFLIFKLVFKLSIFRSKNKTFHIRKKIDAARLGDLVCFALNTIIL